MQRILATILLACLMSNSSIADEATEEAIEEYNRDIAKFVVKLENIELADDAEMGYLARDAFFSFIRLAQRVEAKTAAETVVSQLDFKESSRTKAICLLLSSPECVGIGIGGPEVGLVAKNHTSHGVKFREFQVAIAKEIVRKGLTDTKWLRSYSTLVCWFNPSVRSGGLYHGMSGWKKFDPSSDEFFYIARFALVAFSVTHQLHLVDELEFEDVQERLPAAVDAWMSWVEENFTRLEAENSDVIGWDVNYAKKRMPTNKDEDWTEIVFPEIKEEIRKPFSGWSRKLPRILHEVAD